MRKIHNAHDAKHQRQQFTGNLTNVDLERNHDIGHFNIDKSRAVQDLVLRDIRAAL